MGLAGRFLYIALEVILGPARGFAMKVERQVGTNG